MSRRILSVSTDTRLLVTRNDVLAAAGYAVSSPRHPEEARYLLSRGGFSAVVIGHSIRPDQRKTIIDELRGIDREVPIVYVYVPPGDANEPLADLSVDVSDPVNLVKALEEKLPAR
jgi:DNA-binding NtrC family response regulator